MHGTAQIPFEFFTPEAPDLENFVVGDNVEAVSLIASLANARSASKPHAAYVLWGGPGVGKSHLLSALASAAQLSGLRVMQLSAASEFPDDAFVDADVLCVDDADRLSIAQQGWLFTAFNHVAQSGGCTVTTGSSAPGLWPMRDDIRTRMGSGLALEILPIPQDGLAQALSHYAATRGFSVSQEVLSYLLSHAQRDLTSLCKTLAGLDRMSLAQKRAVTIPLLRAYMTQSRDMHRS
ncbi:MAG: DnaA regulatory inactivator Hda [Rhizobacter sp.]|nr:DnaA regulatory inactivator Hda [Burkholderiales bacterium]